MDTACARYRTELSAFLDGQLDAKDNSEVQGHLTGCSNCSDELETLRKLTKFLTEQMQPDNAQYADMPELWTGIQAEMGSVCDVMKDDLSAYLDGELTPAAQEGVNKHLKECTSCLNAFKKLNAANRLLTKGLELPLTVKVDLWPAVKSQLNQDCALIRSELSAYADQEVVNLRHRSITNHLIECQECRIDFNGVSRVGDIIRDSFRPDLAEDFDLWPGIRDKMQVVPFAAKSAATSTAAKSISARPRWIAGAVAAVAVGIAGLVLTFAVPKMQSGETISSESYLIESAMMEPSFAEPAVYVQE